MLLTFLNAQASFFSLKSSKVTFLINLSVIPEKSFYGVNTYLIELEPYKSQIKISELRL